ILPPTVALASDSVTVEMVALTEGVEEEIPLTAWNISVTIPLI
ncbi:hypothetical protein Tco_0685332, partial [Tanacetum coccineum]